jgi:chorismate mutase/prephenate dehydratase
LLGNQQTRLADVRDVYSHPQALAQCASYIARQPNLRATTYFDTAGAAAFVAASDRADIAAIASVAAAQRYGLKTLAKGIQDQPDNFTRFLVIKRGLARWDDANIDAKIKISKGKGNLKEEAIRQCSVAFTVRDAANGLGDILGIIAKYGLSLRKLTTRPIAENPWSYTYFADLQCLKQQQALAALLREIKGVTNSLKLLGVYSAHTKIFF